MILPSLKTCLTDKSDIRRPSVWCIRELVRGNALARKAVTDAGFTSTLRHICERHGGSVMTINVSSSPTGRLHSHPHSVMAEDDKEIIQQAREALDYLEHGDAYLS